MEIIKQFSIFTKFPERHWIEGKSYKRLGQFVDYLGVIPGQPHGLLLTPVIYPQMATAYLDLEIEGSGIGVATKVRNQYQYFTGEYWEATEKPIFQHPNIIEKGITSLAINKLQFILRLSASGSFESLSLSYEVPNSLSRYLLEFTLPQALQQIPITFSRQIYSNTEGKAYLPEGFDLSLIEGIRLKEWDKEIISGTKQSDRSINTQNPLSPETPLLVTFSSRVHASCQGQEEAQIEYLPNIFVIASQELSQSRRLVQENGETIRGFNLPVEVLITANTSQDADAIAWEIIRLFDNDGRLYAPGFDLELGVQVLGLPKTGASGSITGGLPTKRLSLLIRNISDN